MNTLTVANEDEEFELWRHYLKLRRSFDPKIALEKLHVSEEYLDYLENKYSE